MLDTLFVPPSQYTVLYKPHICTHFLDGGLRMQEDQAIPSLKVTLAVRPNAMPFEAVSFQGLCLGPELRLQSVSA